MVICNVMEHFSLNRIFLLFVDLWPFQRTKLQCQVFYYSYDFDNFYYISLTSFLTECTIDFRVKILSYILFSSTFLITYSSFIINQPVTYTLCNLFIFLLLPIFPRVIDIVLFINKSQSRHMIYFTTEYFIDQEKYFYPILLYMDAACSIGGIALIAIESLLIGYFKHACAIFKIASYHIRQAILISIERNKIRGFNKIKHAMDIHCEAIIFQVAGEIKKNFSYMLVVQLLSLHIYSYIFLSDYIGQEIMDHSKEIFITTYDVPWYISPLRLQKIVLFLLLRSKKNFNLILGRIFVTSFESAATMMNTAVSYFTVLYSIKRN
ncbi:hypothetical protein HN011_005069 [Eciton burchellii]|nr:hypothetical protein HN011_005069 [Eciton burchellii]